MKKKAIIAISICTLILLVVLGVIIFRTTAMSDFSPSGRLVVCSDGFSAYSFKTKQIKKICNVSGGFDVEFNNDKTKYISCDLTNDQNKFNIFEITAKTGERADIITALTGSGPCGIIPRYRPESDQISYISNGTFCLYDTSSKEKTAIDGLCKNTFSEYSYSWNQEGTKIVYMNDDDSISLYDFNTQTSKKLFSGTLPEFSKDGKYIAFQREGCLIIYDIASMKERNLGKNEYESLRFSPDDRYIAIGNSYYDFLGILEYTIKIVDSKTGKTRTLFQNGYATLGFDWI
jgi:Periplasmic component of the Tol biopolymer transport system